MTELAAKTCTPCRGGVPPLEPAEAEAYLGEAADWSLLGRRPSGSSAPSGSRTSSRRFAFVGRVARRSPRPRATTPTSASAGATPRSRSIPTRSKACTRTTSSWRPRSTALARPRAGLKPERRAGLTRPCGQANSRPWRAFADHRHRRRRRLGHGARPGRGRAGRRASCCSRATRRSSARSREHRAIRAISRTSRSSPAIRASGDLAASGRRPTSLLLTVPAQALRRSRARCRRAAAPLVICAKGLRDRDRPAAQRGGGGRAAGQPARGALGPELRARGGATACRPRPRSAAPIRRSAGRSPRR